MPMLHSLIKVAAKPVPAVISPRAHAILDYVTVGIFLAGASWFWRRNKRASIAAGLCGGAKLAVSMMTAYPGGVRRLRQKRGLRKAGNRVRFQHVEILGLGLKHEIDPGKARAPEELVDLERHVARSLCHIGF